MHIYKPLLTIFCLVCSVSVAFAASADARNLLPVPQRVEFAGRGFKADAVRVSSPVLAELWREFVEGRGGRVDERARAAIEVRVVPQIEEAVVNPDEAYRLSVGPAKISIEATTERGVYWAMQTLAQLERTGANGLSFEGCEVVDWPAFRVRGFLHDVGRRYISLDEIKREIRLLSKFKVNVFHWHLTENQSWRLESKIFPMLNDSANTTRMPGLFYTLDEARDLVEFAKRHNVLLIPEIDMPGHSEAFVRTFRHDMQSPEGVKILKLLVDEVCETFDVPWLHIGTDEVRFTNPDFVGEMVARVRAKGKKVISWNPGWQYAPGEVDMTHLWSYRGEARRGIPAIDSRFHYLNHFDTFGDVIALYNSRVYDRPQGDDDLAGCIVAVWNDRFVADERNVLLENNFYPNVLAMAERAWRGGGTEYFDKNGTILTSDDSEEFRAFADFERRMLWHRDNTLRGEPFAYVRQTNVRWAITDAFPNGGDLSLAFPPEHGLSDSYSYEGKEYGTREAIGAGIYLRHVWGKTVPAFYADPQENHTAYAYTWVHSPCEQEVGMWIEFQNYSRSEADLPPPQGKWNWAGGRIWLNDQEILPPRWTAAHTVRDNETPLGNENCVARPPTPVSLRKGWNKVLLKVPVGRFRTPEVRLVKWMFTAVFVTPDGQRAVEGLTYSPKSNLSNNIHKK